MGNRLISTFIGLMAAVSGPAAPEPCSPSVPSLSARELLQNGAIVKSGSSTGLGFVVGWRQGEAWVAVPAHVVFGEGVTPTDMTPYREGLEVQLFGDPASRRLCDEGPTPPQGFADLAFICVEWSGKPFFNEGVLARKVRIGDELTLVDPTVEHRSSGSITKVPVAGEAVREKGDIEAQGIGGVKGLSGALAASAGGAVGLYLGQGTAFPILSMPAIRMFAGVADVPWQLGYSEYYDCTATRKVCFTAETEIAPATVTMRNIFSPGSYSLPAGSCTALPEGRYEIAVPPLGPTCEPKLISVYSAAEDLQLALRCSVALMGNWRTEDGDELICVEIQMGRAQCSGLGKQGFGFFEGTINARGQSFAVMGSFFDAAGNSREASGSFRWSGESLTGEIRRQLEPPKQLKLKRVEDK